MGKGSARRPPQIGREEEALRWEFAFGLITKEMFAQKYVELVRANKIIRSGKILQHGDSGND